MKFIRIISVALAFSFVIVLVGCAKEKTDTYSLLCDLLLYSGEDTDGSGYIYSSSADEESIGYLSDGMLRRLYGEKYEKSAAPLVEDAALFISARGAGELALFRCYSSSDTDTLLKLLLERADTLKVGLRGSAYEQKSEGIVVEIRGKYVLFCFVEEPMSVSDRFDELI